MRLMPCITVMFSGHRNSTINNKYSSNYKPQMERILQIPGSLTRFRLLFHIGRIHEAFIQREPFVNMAPVSLGVCALWAEGLFDKPPTCKGPLCTRIVSEPRRGQPHIARECMRACVRACVRACMRACVRAWVRVCWPLDMLQEPTSARSQHATAYVATVLHMTMKRWLWKPVTVVSLPVSVAGEAAGEKSRWLPGLLNQLASSSISDSRNG